MAPWGLDVLVAITRRVNFETEDPISARNDHEKDDHQKCGKRRSRFHTG